MPLSLLLTAVLQAGAVPPVPPAAPASAPQLDKVEVRGASSANSRRRNSTASKIVIDRDELQRYGDTQLGDVLRRLPGVTLGGRPGRGGDIRLRGMGGGFTQILIDGERAPAGFNAEALPPDQVERIEILRAPTAETGARAVAGTLNIILREPLVKRTNELRVGLGGDHGEPQFDFNATRNGRWFSDELVGALNLSGHAVRRFNDIDLTSQGASSRSTQLGTSLFTGRSLNTNARLRWKLSDTQSLHLSPVAFVNRGKGHSQFAATGFSSFDAAGGTSESFSNFLRLNATWQGRFDAHRLEARFGTGSTRSGSDSQRRETQAGQFTRTQQDRVRTRDDNRSAGFKWSVQTAKEHQWVSGLEWEAGTRAQTRTTMENGRPKSGFEDFGDELAARTRRVAAYTQDEWSPNKQWSLYAGLRWEQITTEGDAGGVLARAINTSRVASPLLHLLYKPPGSPRDQVRASLTRSYRSPGLNDLIARPVLSSSYPSGANPQTSPDRAGNPLLKPELATGLDLSWEHWLDGGGVLTATAFERRIDGLIRNLLARETVPWDAQARWVSRPRNLDRAVSRGIELEAKSRLDELWPDAPDALAGLLLRMNLALFDSQVDGIPGPNNRLEQQPRGTLNLGADYLWPGGVRSGFNWGYVPASTIQQTPTVQREDNLRSVWDAYLQWNSGDVREGLTWRLSLANLAPRDTLVVTRVDNEGVRSASWDRKRTFAVWNLRVETRF
jgi:outer membrane receptor for ferrienterochelin and colicins